MAIDNKANYWIPRKSYFTVSPGFLRSKLLQFGLDTKVAVSLAEGLHSIFNKFAVDERLNYDKIERVLRGAGTRDSTLVIAANDTSDVGKAAADIVCPGLNDHSYINYALAFVANTGAKLLFLEGTYVLGDVITGASGNKMHGMTMEGMGASTIFQIATSKNGLHIGWPDAADQNEWTIRGIKFKGGNVGIDVDIDGRNIITDCFFESQATHGIYLQDTSGAGVLISNNIFNTVGTQTGSGTNGCGVSIDNCSNVIIEGNTFIGGGGLAQINFGTADSSLIIGNYCASALKTAIFGSSTTDDLIIGNNIIGPAVNGIEIASGSFDARDNDILNNRIANCGQYGISVGATFGQNDDTKISGNHIQDCGRDGILLGNDVRNFLVSDNLISDCGTATANTYSGINFKTTGTNNACMGNKIKGAGHKYAINNAATATLIVNNDCIGGYTTAKINNTGTATLNLDGSANDWNRA